MSKPIAVQGCTIGYSVDGGTVSVVGEVSAASSHNSVNGNKCYIKNITVDILAGTTVLLTTPPEGAASGSGTLVLPGTITISGTSSKTSDGENAFVLQDDDGSASFQFAFPASSGTNPVTSDVTIKAEVSKAGQNVVNVT